MILRNIRSQSANLVWNACCQPDYRALQDALSECEGTQSNYLMQLLQSNRESLYGQKHNFREIDSYEKFRKIVPLTSYENYSPYIDQISKGERGIVTSEDVSLFEPTSGTSSGCKLIPYTAKLKREFQRGINPWIASLFAQHPELRKGRSYWSISPPQPDRIKSHGVMPVGFDNDWGYLGTLGKLFHACIAVRPERISKPMDTSDFRNTTMAALLNADDLTLISVWSPSFLRLLLEWYMEHQEQVLDIMEQSRNTSRKRIQELRKLGSGPDVFKKIWPRLQVVSCWKDAASANESKRLIPFFPETHIQGKGLIATEAFISLPFIGDHDPVLASRSHFFEFIADNGDILPAHQTQKDQEYSVVVTTGGGLYRYCMGDRILVTGFSGNTPTIRFTGKAELVSDFYGEKLNASHVSQIIDFLLRDQSIRFAMLAPDLSGEKHSYTLYVEPTGSLPHPLADMLEEQLCGNPHYRYCRELGQLSPARVFILELDGFRVYYDQRLAMGFRPGDIKPTPLIQQDGWSERFSGKYEERK